MLLNGEVWIKNVHMHAFYNLQWVFSPEYQYTWPLTIIQL